jgi:hypothetical protein
MNMSRDTDKLLAEASPASKIIIETKEFLVTVCLGDKLWNEEVKRYLYRDIDSENIFVSETDIVTFKVTSIWGITDRLWNDEFLTVKIERI